tara:strand:+ start:29 stop:871 length:843 start_codon:yes stop_codon:yes gene_type:complete
MLRNKQTTSKNIILIGGYGSGKTTTAIEMMGNRPYQIYPANDIAIDDIYSYPNNHGLIIEDVHYKPMKDKILSLILINPHIILTSLNEKDVSKTILNMCVRKRLGRTDKRQDKIKEVAPNCIKPIDLNKNIYDINFELLKNKDRRQVLKIVKHNKPSDMQLLSWVQPNVDVRSIVFADHVMRLWSIDYFYEILTYSLAGYLSGRPSFPKRNTYSPVPKICSKLGLKTRDSYLVKSFLMNDEYKEWATKKLSSDECKILNLKKPRKKSVRVTKINKTLGDF